MPFYIVWHFQLSEDLFRKDLSEFNTHLICEMPSAIKKVSDELKERALTKRVNAPDDTLYKDLVLIQSNKSTCRSTVNIN